MEDVTVKNVIKTCRLLMTRRQEAESALQIIKKQKKPH